MDSLERLIPIADVTDTPAARIWLVYAPDHVMMQHQKVDSMKQALRKNFLLNSHSVFKAVEIERYVRATPTSNATSPRP